MTSDTQISVKHKYKCLQIDLWSVWMSYFKFQTYCSISFNPAVTHHIMPKIGHYHGSQNWLPNRSTMWHEKKMLTIWLKLMWFYYFWLISCILALTALTAPNLDPSSAQNNPFVPWWVPKILPCHGHRDIVPKCRTDPACHSHKAVPNCIQVLSLPQLCNAHSNATGTFRPLPLHPQAPKYLCRLYKYYRPME
jgi:hypothetical protein